MSHSLVRFGGFDIEFMWQAVATYLPIVPAMYPFRFSFCHLLEREEEDDDEVKYLSASIEILTVSQQVFTRTFQYSSESVAQKLLELAMPSAVAPTRVISHCQRY